MIALVTGGTGFVGGHLCERLRREGWTVRVLARKTSRVSLLEKAGCEIVRGTLDTEKTIRRAAADADVLFHLAAITKAASTREFYRINSEGTKSVLVAAQEGGFKGRFVLLSSQSAAGPAINGREVTESDEPRPVSHYGRSKLLGEKLAAKARDAFPVTILRPGAIYGPREHEIYQIVRMIQRTGLTFTIGPDFDLQMTHVADVVEALLLGATHAETANKTYFVTDPQPWRYRQVLGLLGEVLERRVRRVWLPRAAGWALASAIDGASFVARRPLSPFNGDKMREMAAGSWLADSGRLTRETGWQARWLLPEGLRQTIAWYRKNGWL